MDELLKEIEWHKDYLLSKDENVNFYFREKVNKNEIDKFIKNKININTIKDTKIFCICYCNKKPILSFEVCNINTLQDDINKEIDEYIDEIELFFIKGYNKNIKEFRKLINKLKYKLKIKKYISNFKYSIECISNNILEFILKCAYKNIIEINNTIKQHFKTILAILTFLLSSTIFYQIISTIPYESFDMSLITNMLYILSHFLEYIFLNYNIAIILALICLIYCIFKHINKEFGCIRTVISIFLSIIVIIYIYFIIDFPNKNKKFFIKMLYAQSIYPCKTYINNKLNIIMYNNDNTSFILDINSSCLDTNKTDLNSSCIRRDNFVLRKDLNITSCIPINIDNIDKNNTKKKKNK